MAETGVLYKKEGPKLRSVMYYLSRMVVPIMILIRSSTVLGGPMQSKSRKSSSTSNPDTSDDAVVNDPDPKTNVLGNAVGNGSVPGLNGIPSGLQPQGCIRPLNPSDSVEKYICFELDDSPGANGDDADYWSSIEDFLPCKFSSFSKHIFRILLKYTRNANEDGSDPIIRGNRRSSMRRCPSYSHDLDKASGAVCKDDVYVICDKEEFVIKLKQVIWRMTSDDFYNLCLEQRYTPTCEEIYAMACVFDIFDKSTKLKESDVEDLRRFLEDGSCQSVLKNEEFKRHIVKKFEEECAKLKATQDEMPLPEQNGETSKSEMLRSQLGSFLRFISNFEKWKKVVENVDKTKASAEEGGTRIRLTGDEISGAACPSVRSWLVAIPRTGNVHVEIGEMHISYIPPELCLLSNVTALTLNFQSQEPSQRKKLDFYRRFMRGQTKRLSLMSSLRSLTLSISDIPLDLVENLTNMPHLEECSLGFSFNLSQQTCDVFARWIGGCQSLKKLAILEFDQEHIPKTLRENISSIPGLSDFSIAVCEGRKQLYIHEEDMEFLKTLKVCSIRVKRLFLPESFFKYFECPENIKTKEVEKAGGIMHKLISNQSTGKDEASQFVFKKKDELSEEDETMIVV